MSMLSLAPATTKSGSLGSMATAGSFCLFCENGLDGAADAHAGVLPCRRARERGDEDGRGERAER